MMETIKTKGITLVELAIGVVVAALIMGGIFALFKSSMSGSKKGLSHLVNLEAAVMLMTQLESDLARNYKFETFTFENPKKYDSLSFYIRDEKAGNSDKYTVIYENTQDCLIKRVLRKNGSIENSHVFCKGLKAEISFVPIEMYNPHSKYGVYAELTVTSPQKTISEPETFTLKRLIMCKNLTE